MTVKLMKTVIAVKTIAKEDDVAVDKFSKMQYYG